ncbi:hypothetical protein JQ625_17115 [Bradyrhizobium diazoefficiens]|nr:hypothetical protein [Bradyrhizobium diazoefficiens]MBR0776559.1 hypothetical protein [Bradyrhizobium diazoefficiens]
MQKPQRAAKPRKDAEREAGQPIIRDADKIDDRDLVHGDGGTTELPTRPQDLGKDD